MVINILQTTWWLCMSMLSESKCLSLTSLINLLGKWFWVPVAYRVTGANKPHWYTLNQELLWYQLCHHQWHHRLSLDNLWCHQWWQSWCCNNSCFSIEYIPWNVYIVLFCIVLSLFWGHCPSDNEVTLGLALLTLSWDKNWDSHSLVNGYPSFYPRIALVAPSPGGYG